MTAAQTHEITRLQTIIRGLETELAQSRRSVSTIADREAKLRYALMALGYSRVAIDAIGAVR